MITWKENLKANYNSDDLTVSFNSRYLLDIASEIQDEKLIMNLNDSMSPVLIQDSSDKQSYFVIIFTVTRIRYRDECRQESEEEDYLLELRSQKRSLQPELQARVKVVLKTTNLSIAVSRHYQYGGRGRAQRDLDGVQSEISFGFKWNFPYFTFPLVLRNNVWTLLTS